MSLATAAGLVLEVHDIAEAVEETVLVLDVCEEAFSPHFQLAWVTPHTKQDVYTSVGRF